jgi:hypothetical protein
MVMPSLAALLSGARAQSACDENPFFCAQFLDEVPELPIFLFASDEMETIVRKRNESQWLG